MCIRDSASLVQIITFAFVLRAAQSANSDSLSEDVREVVKKNPTLAFKLIDLNIVLDSPKAIPRQKLKQLHKDVEKDLVAARLLQIMVLNRLYMFKVIVHSPTRLPGWRESWEAASLCERRR